MRRRILIADDEPSIVMSLEFLMRQAGYDVQVAADGVEALAAVETFRPDLLLLDVMMPRRNGLDVCHAIRSNPALAATKIVLLSAKGREHVLRGLSLGADAYVVKPFATRELMATVSAILGAAAHP